MKVLIIEDHVDTAWMLKELFSPQHDVSIAHTGKDAIESSIHSRPDLIISDWNLRDEIDGVTACRQILENCKPIVIFVSGSPIEQLTKVAEALSPLHIFSKPLDIELFSNLIQKVSLELHPDGVPDRPLLSE